MKPVPISIGSTHKNCKMIAHIIQFSLNDHAIQPHRFIRKKRYWKRNPEGAAIQNQFPAPKPLF